MNKVTSHAERTLLRECASAWREGVDFPTIWQETLGKHPLVAGQAIQGNNHTLRIRLVSGRWLVFGSKGFSIR
jgi:hypothetical protein